MLLLLIDGIHETVAQRHTQKPKQRSIFFAERYQPRFAICVIKSAVNFFDALFDHEGVVDANVVSVSYCIQFFGSFT